MKRERITRQKRILCHVAMRFASINIQRSIDLLRYAKIAKKLFIRQLENVVMVGYPNGLFDSQNNHPLFRTGKTATHPAIDYNGQRKALLDMACLPGSSGSPVFILDEGWIRNKNGGMCAGSRILFLGVENSMPTRYVKAVYKKAILSDGEVNYIPTDDYLIENDMKLGYYIKSSEMWGFDAQIQNLGL